MKQTISIISIIGIAAFAGNMLNIGLSHAIYWQSLEPMAFMKSFAIDFPLLLAPTALTLMPAWLGTLWLYTKGEKNPRAENIGCMPFLVYRSLFYKPPSIIYQ